MLLSSIDVLLKRWRDKPIKTAHFLNLLSHTYLKIDLICKNLRGRSVFNFEKPFLNYNIIIVRDMQRICFLRSVLIIIVMKNK